jgi:DNA-binding transcriptional ArsR family regulator
MGFCFHSHRCLYVCRIVWMARNPDTCDLLCLDLPKAERVREGLPRGEELELWAAGAKALGDPTRLAVALALDAGESACVCDLAWIVGRDERLVSHHARQLKIAGIARSERDGKMVMYELTNRGRALVAAVSSQEVAR